VLALALKSPASASTAVLSILAVFESRQRNEQLNNLNYEVVESWMDWGMNVWMNGRAGGLMDERVD
jgi:hypothetical protein